MTDVVERDPFDLRFAVRAPGHLRAFNDAGVLRAADVHVARRIAELGEEPDDDVVLAVALAVRAPRLGSVFVDLEQVRAQATTDLEDVDLAALPWPEPAGWVAAVAASALVAVGEEEGPADRPLRLLGSRLHLDRYWREERGLAADLLALMGTAPEVDEAVLADGLPRVFARREEDDAPATAEPPVDGPAAEAPAVEAPPDAGTRPAAGRPRAPAASAEPFAQTSLFDVPAGPAPEPDPEPRPPLTEPAPAAPAPVPQADDGPDLQQQAAAAAVRHRFAVVAGGPGTGKTTTVARIVALLDEQAAAHGRPLPLVALAAPTGRAATRLQEAVHAEAAKLVDPDPQQVARLRQLKAVTLHKLLGARPGKRRPQHGRANRLPHDVVIVDETSMVSLEMMARLVEAVRPDARLVLVGDPGQLRSVDAGAVLGDIVGEGGQPHVTVLTRVRRYGRGIGRVADAVRDDDPDAAVAALEASPKEVTWIDADAADLDAVVPAIRGLATDTFTRAHAHASAGDTAGALKALAELRLLCAHRRGPYGVAQWTALVEQWLGDLAGDRRFAVGRPLLITENDPALQLNNGDLGVVVQDPDDPDRVLAAFDRAPEPLCFSPSRLSAVETAYVMTVHKAQGGQVGTAVVLLPPPDSPLLTRELVYTAITRAEDHLVLVGTEAALRTAIGRPALRASGLRERLAGAG